MSKRRAITVGLLTLWPFVAMILLPCVMIGTIEETSDSTGALLGTAICALFGLTTLDLIAMHVVYIVHAATSDRVARDLKAVWVVLLLLLNIIVMPIFWYLYMWKRPKLQTYEPSAQVLG